MELYPADPITDEGNEWTGEEVIKYAEERQRLLQQTITGLKVDAKEDRTELECYTSEKAINERFTDYLVYRFGKEKVFKGTQLAIMEDGWTPEEVRAELEKDERF